MLLVLLGLLLNSSCRCPLRCDGNELMLAGECQPNDLQPLPNELHCGALRVSWGPQDRDENGLRARSFLLTWPTLSSLVIVRISLSLFRSNPFTPSRPFS